MNNLIKEFKNFSKENWWVYLLLAITLWIVISTWRGSLIEIILLFLWNFLANLFIMVAMWNYSKKNNLSWAYYHALWTLTFVMLGVYGWLFQEQYQYILWQIAYTLAAIKAFTYYTYKKNINILNEVSFVFLNIWLFILFLLFFEYQTFSILQVIWFSFVTTWLVSTSDAKRFWMSYIWMFWIVSWSALWTYNSFSVGNIDGIALGFLLLSLTVFVYFTKLLQQYIPIKK